MPKYLIEYDYADSRWSLEMYAEDFDDLTARVEALADAKIIGEIHEKFAAPRGAHLRPH